ncbi:MAG: hypothetical protein ABWZ66_01175 [Pyrinomonadaceae bacterium]
MDINKLIAIVTIIMTLSVASERLVEIIKGFFPEWFTEVPPIDVMIVVTEEAEQERKRKEARRKANVSILAIFCGMLTAFLASPILASIFKDLFANSSCKPLANLPGSLDWLPCGANISFNGIILTLAMGLLASGGSTAWNSILEYLLKVKQLKAVQVDEKEALKSVRINDMKADLRAEKANRLTNEQE